MLRPTTGQWRSRPVIRRRLVRSTEMRGPRGEVVASGDEVTDPTLVDALLEMSPEERLLLNDRMLQTIQELRDGF